MPSYSEQDLKYAAELREEIHRDALARVKALYPEADQVMDEIKTRSAKSSKAKRFSRRPVRIPG